MHLVGVPDRANSKTPDRTEKRPRKGYCSLTKIQSLPIIGREWEYQFYVDVAFNDYLRYKQSIAAITPLTKELKLLGEYAEGKSNV